MSEIEYVKFEQVNPKDFLPVLNEPTLRTHLIAHAPFDTASVREWMDAKRQSGSLPGCRVRAAVIDDVLAGWCGIQPDDDGFEMAIVIAQEFWGFGISIFKTLMRWADELGHEEIVFHLLETRPEYRFLKGKALSVQKTELLGRSFTTYRMSVAEWNRPLA